MSTSLAASLRGIGAFLPGAPDWPHLRDVLLGRAALDASAPARPGTSLLPATERRRAPAGVLLATEVARQACAMAGAAPDALPCVFASTHGEIAITDYVCSTLARAPRELSPTKFHNSVLNAPAGYWTMATGCHCASSAISAHSCSLGAGLLEAASIAHTDSTPVLLALCDVAAAGPLRDVLPARTSFAAAFVLTPGTGGRSFDMTLDAMPSAPPVPAPIAPSLSAVGADDPTAAQALALLELFAKPQPARLALPLSAGLALTLEVSA